MDPLLVNIYFVFIVQFMRQGKMMILIFFNEDLWARVIHEVHLLSLSLSLSLSLCMCECVYEVESNRGG